jgi:hypothetical protein
MRWRHDAAIADGIMLTVVTPGNQADENPGEIGCRQMAYRGRLQQH